MKMWSVGLVHLGWIFFFLGELFLWSLTDSFRIVYCILPDVPNGTSVCTHKLIGLFGPSRKPPPYHGLNPLTNEPVGGSVPLQGYRSIQEGGNLWGGRWKHLKGGGVSEGMDGERQRPILVMANSKCKTERWEHIVHLGDHSLYNKRVANMYWVLTR